MDPLVLPTAGAAAPNLLDAKTGRTVAFTQVAGGAGRGWGATFGRPYVGFAGTVGAYPIPFAPAFTCPQGLASPINPIHIFGFQWLSTSAALPPANTDQGIFFKACTGAVGSVYNNSVAFGVIPADERAFGVNHDAGTGAFNFVSIVGGIGRTVTPLGAWPAAFTSPVLVEYRFFEATADRPVAAFELYLNTTRVIQANMSVGNTYGLPFDFNAARPCWLPTWNATVAPTDCACSEMYYRCGPTLAGVA